MERIRTLFVPSLEPRIHSCLETFVYRRESGEAPNQPYLRRCLDAAATLRDPVEAFCTKWRETGIVETMLAGLVKFLISDGPIDCVLNSIVLNNRLNKVCRDLDALGVERDLLRHLAVWNYINERDYWQEDDKVMYVRLSSYHLHFSSVPFVDPMFDYLVKGRNITVVTIRKNFRRNCLCTK